MNREIRRAISQAYAKIGTEGSKPPLGMDFPTGRALALSLGYPGALLDRIPDRALESFVGAAPLVSEVLVSEPCGLVADCGCGSGVDSLVLALGGHTVASIDAQPEMLARLAESACSMGLSDRVYPLLALLPRLPLATGCARWLLLNGVANLVEDRRELLSEAARVLAPGGRLLIADVVALEPLSPELKNDPASWAWCVGGAGTGEEWFKALVGAGFSQATLELSESFPPLGRGVLRATRKA